MAEAVRQALGGRPGPVLLALPEDLLDEIAPDPWRGRASAGRRPASDGGGDPEVLHLLAGAERPVILAGAGVLRARTSTDLVNLAELLHVPVIAAWRHGDVIPNEHPLYLGMAGFGAPPEVRARLEAADAILVLGSRLSESTSFGYTDAGARDALDPRRYRSTPARRSAAGGAADRIRRPDVPEGGQRDPDEPRRPRCRALDTGREQAADRSAWQAGTVVDATPWDGPGVHPGRVVTALREALPDDAILTTDAGNFGGWAGRGFRFRRPGRSLARHPAPWAMASRPRSPRPSSIGTGWSSPWSATAAWG